jgi:hypothetical protein
MATNQKIITDLDFDTIKQNLKTFLKAQSEFSDYDFEGSGLNVLIDVLAYNTHYNAYYLNMAVNEAFMDTAILRDSVVGHAKTLGYIPHSSRAAKAVVNLTTPATPNSQLTLSRGTKFRSSLLDNISYNFVLLEDVTVSAVGSEYIFENLEIYEGALTAFRYVNSVSQNPNAVFIIPSKNVDTSTLRVSVTSASNTSTEVYELVTDVLNITQDSAVYFLEENRDQFFQIRFGDGVIGKALEDGAIINMTYLVTSGALANKVSEFTPVDYVLNSVNFVVETVEPAAGGSNRESVDSIKYNAIAQFSTQNRLVTKKDYEVLLKQAYPTIDAISVWGGEEESPPVYGKMFISLKPKDGYFFSQTEKQRIIDETIVPKSVVTVSTEIRDPDYLYLLFGIKVKYDPKKTILSQEALKILAASQVYEYRDIYLNDFNSSVVISKLQERIDSIDNAVLGNDVTLKLQKRFEPKIGIKSSYVLNFGVPLSRGTNSLDRLQTTTFGVLDSADALRNVTLEEVPQSFTGISEILVANPGYDYTSDPIITITGDGTGAEAKATVVNGRIQSIELTKRGTDYSRAVVAITDATGKSASATAVIDSKIGNLRTVYYDINAERKIVNDNAGTVNYETGLITINDITIESVDSFDGFLRVTVESDEGLIQSVRNTILTVDDTDPSAVEVSLIKSSS